uniref:Mitochondrial carrier 1 n=1 Tax=Buteo japonicus TaxID=224669 RepID=A0A8B9Z6J9_9AVES
MMGEGLPMSWDLLTGFLLQVGHEPLPPTVGRNVLGRKVLYLPGFFTYARHIVEVDGKRGLFRGLTPRLISSTLSTITRGSVKKVKVISNESCSNEDHQEELEVMRVEGRESRRVRLHFPSHPLQPTLDLFLCQPCVSFFLVISMRCMVQFVGREVKYSGVPLCWWREGRAPQKAALGPFCTSRPSFCHCSGLVPRILGDVIFLWCCNLLAHFINTYAVDDNVSGSAQWRVWGIAVSMLTYPFLLVGDLMAVNNCGLRAGLPPYAPAFTSWIHCWRYLSAQVREWGTHRASGSLCSFPRSPALPQKCLCCILDMLCNAFPALQFWRWYQAWQYWSARYMPQACSLQTFSQCIAHSKARWLCHSPSVIPGGNA